MEPDGTILIADPESEFLSHWAAVLSEEGYRVFTTDKGSQAIQIIQEEKVDLLVMEADFPEIKAYEAIPIIKGVDPHLPIIITASHNTPELEARIRRRPIFYYHVKSFGPEELRLAIRNAMERQAKTSKGDNYGQYNPAD
jgi:two-component system, NtrC family, phosphoglycerate transport system response regulator PgtA